MALLSNINDKFAVDSTGAIQFNGQVGTSGYILKSNANAAPTWVDPSTVIGGPYLPLTGGTLTGATATATGISFTVGGTLTGTTATFTGNVISLDTFYLQNGSGKRWQQLFDGNNWNIRYYNGTDWSADALAIDTSNNATFAGSITGTTASFSGQVTIPETPTADAHAASKKYVDDNTGNADVAKRLEVTVKNVSGGSLAKGVVVHAAPTATPPSGNVIEVIAADANDAAKMPAIGVLNETIADEAEGEAVMFGAVSGIDTSGFSIADELYVSETAGEFTATKPTAFASQVQKIAVVIKSHASNGLIKVFGAGRSNDVPNRVNRDMNFTDDSELTFGDSSDLKIYHSTNNIVRINSGDLIFNSFVDDGDIKFQLDNGSDPAGLTEYMRLDGGVQRIIYGRSQQMVDNLKLYFGNDTANDASIKWDSTASQLFIDGESKFLSNAYDTVC